MNCEWKITVENDRTIFMKFWYGYFNVFKFQINSIKLQSDAIIFFFVHVGRLILKQVGTVLMII